MTTTRRAFAQTLASVGTASLWWDHAVAEVEAQGTLTDDTVQALLATQGGAGIFADADRFAELRSALERSALRLATLRAFRLPPDVGPAVVFTRD